MARDVPDNRRKFPQGSRVEHIANIRATSEIITSAFGDERLFFQHERKKHDFEHKPEFKKFVEKLDRDDSFDGQVPNNLGDWPTDDVTARAWVRGSLSEM